MFLRTITHFNQMICLVSKARITKICENKFGAARGHDGQKRSLIFNKNTIQKLQNNYAPIKEIAILSANITPNTFNTFNTFWDNVERNGDHKGKFNGNKITKSKQGP